MRRFISANFAKKRIDLFLYFLFLRIHSFNNSITMCVYYFQLFLNVSYAYKCPSILFKITHAGKLFPLLSTCSMQTFTYYVQTKNNLGRTVFAMIIVYINNVLFHVCQPSHHAVMDLYLFIIPIGIHIADLYSTKEVFCFLVTF